MSLSINTRIKQYFAARAGLNAGEHHVNTILRRGLEAMGYSGTINRMLREWAQAIGGSGTSLNTAFRIAVGTYSSADSLNTRASEFFARTDVSILIENGWYLDQESGDKILLEGAA